MIRHRSGIATYSGLSANTLLLAAASLFADTSTEMLYPVLPIFLTQTLGASVGVVGIVEGVAQAVQNVAQGVSGWFSDTHGRKPIALVGYLVAAISKPIIGLCTSWPGVLVARASDRVGAGTRSAPRDALIAGSVDASHRGTAFGLEGSATNLGAFLGPMVAIALLGAGHVGLRSIFFLAVVPGLLAALMVAFVREPPEAPSAGVKLGVDVRRLPATYWRYLLASAIFGVGNSSNSFLILRTKALGASMTTTIFIYALFNLVAALASSPAGFLSDRLGRRDLLLLSLMVFLGVYAGFGLTTNVVIIGILFVLYGTYQGIFRSVGKTLATDLVSEEIRATGVGWYAATIGITGLVASALGGVLWTELGPPATFLFGAGFALVGGVALVLLVPRTPGLSAAV